MSRLALSVFEQVAGLALERGAESGQRVAVDSFGYRVAHQVVDGLACEPRQGREAVAREPRLFRHLVELPAYRHGVSIAFPSTLDKRQRSVYYTAIPQRSMAMATQNPSFTSGAAIDLASMARVVMQQARQAEQPMRSHLVAIARDQWRSALGYQRKLDAVVEYVDDSWMRTPRLFAPRR